MSRISEPEALTRVLFIPNDISTGGEGSYLEDLTAGLSKKGIECGCVAVENRGDRYENLAGTFSLCRDLSARPAGLRKISELARAIAQFRPTHLICSARIAHYVLPFLGPEVSPIAVLHSDNENFYRRATRFPERVSAWVCPSPRVAQGMSQRLSAAHQSRVCMIPHGVNDEPFRDVALPLEERGADLLFVGALYEHKGAHLLPTIVGKVTFNEIVSPRITLIGEGVLRECLVRDFETRGLRANFLGRQDRQDVARLMGGTKVFLLPTRVEGFGLVLAEAMMAGAVPVVSRLPGITDGIVDDGQNGFLLEPDDTDGFSDRISLLLNDRSLWTKMSQEARQKARENFCLLAVSCG
ncbi:MAG: glycosyltransferase family 4 protein [Acidobacteriota bacterium]